MTFCLSLSKQLKTLSYLTSIRTYFPPRLENALIVMCVSYYKAAGLGTTQAAVGPVASVKRGDVQTSFANASGASGSASTFNLAQTARTSSAGGRF